MRAVPILPAALLIAAVTIPAQAPPDQDAATIKVDVSLVNILCSVRNKNNGLVGNLEKRDFTLYEDSKQQEIKYFTRETDLPLTIGMLVDISGSQERLIDTERRAAYQFFSQVLRKKDEAFLISFGPEAELLQDFTSSPKLLQDGLSQLRVSVPVGGLHPGPVPTQQSQAGTILYDAVYLAANEKLKSEVGRKAIVVITDGVDTGSKISRDKAIEAAQRADAIIYSFFYQDLAAYGGFGGFGGAGGERELARMSSETGGRVFHIDRRYTLEEAFKDLQDEMRTQYALGYSSTNPKKDGTYRKLDIKMANKDMKVQARKGYYAVETGN